MIIPISIFGFVVLSALSVYWILSRQPSEAAERLEKLGQPGEAATPAVKESTTARLAERVAEPINRILPPSPGQARKLQLKLMYAGYLSPNAPLVYRAIQLISLIGFPLVTTFFFLSIGHSLKESMVWIAIALCIGYLLPRTILDQMIKGRQQRLRWGLADALDLLVVSIEAGLGLNAAIVCVSEELKTVHPDISSEFELANLEIRVGRQREAALRNLADRTGVDDLRGLCAMMIQADRFGTSISRAVRVYADSLRTKRRQRAEQAAQKAAVKLLFPLACFLFPTLFIVILGPAAIQLIDNFFNK